MAVCLFAVLTAIFEAACDLVLSTTRVAGLPTASYHSYRLSSHGPALFPVRSVLSAVSAVSSPFRSGYNDLDAPDSSDDAGTETETEVAGTESDEEYFPVAPRQNSRQKKFQQVVSTKSIR